MKTTHQKEYYTREMLEGLLAGQQISAKFRQRIECALRIGTPAAYRACGEVSAGGMKPIPAKLRRAFQQACKPGRTN